MLPSVTVLKIAGSPFTPVLVLEPARPQLDPSRSHLAAKEHKDVWKARSTKSRSGDSQSQGAFPEVSVKVAPFFSIGCPIAVFVRQCGSLWKRRREES